MLLHSATLADGRSVDVRIADGVITEIGPDLVAAGDDVVDLGGRLLLSAFAEPHAHLDKAFLAERIINETGDLMGAILAMHANRHLVSLEDTIERAERAVRLMVANGTTLIRSHADTTIENGLMSVEALAEVRRRTADVCDLEIVALVGWPITGSAGADSRALLRDALDAGADVVGGCPHLEDDPCAATDQLLDIAAERGRSVDLHTDETLDPAKLALEHLARRIVETGFPHRVAASHCVSLAMQPEARQHEVAALVAEAGISVVALPHTNLFLQGRDHQQAMPRALTAVKALREAGVNVCAGADNLQDPFNPMGRADPLETGALMVMTAHLLPDAALDAVSGAVHRAITGSHTGITPGAPAELVAIAAAGVREALAFGPSGRMVFHQGRLVSGSPLGK
ncbi:MAG: codA [Ilumatobacteraceae bacterium]|nr:codA [Ilumatobacteraceae bacterium]